jgi:hypothetical protein
MCNYTFLNSLYDLCLHCSKPFLDISFSISSFFLADKWMFLQISYLSFLMVLLAPANSLDLSMPLARH